jgi:hypothetical protein
VPLAADAPLLLKAVDLGVAFPVRKGLRRVVDHNRVVKALNFQLRAGKPSAWWANRDREKHHRAGAAAPDCLGRDNRL